MVIPTDWEEVRLGDISEVKTGPFGSSLHASDYVTQGTPIITVEHLGEFRLQGEKAPLVGMKDTTRLSSYVLRPGDLVFSRVGSIGRFGYVEESENGWLFSGRLLRLRIRQGHPRFLYFQMCGMKFISQILKVAVGQTMPSLNTVLVGNLKVSFPPLREQEAIAEALSDADAAIESLDALIAKKGDVKQAAMQQLLTGRTRLPGFSGGWEEIRLGELCQIYQPTTIGGKDFQDSGEYVVYGANGPIGRYSRFNHEQSEVTVTCRGATCGTVNVTPPKVWITGNAMVVRPKTAAISKLMLKYILEVLDYSEMITGAAQPQITRASLSPSLILVPAAKEQKAIAETLSVMDDELEALIEQVSKLRMVKEGMMQNLLTGKVRLV